MDSTPTKATALRIIARCSGLTDSRRFIGKVFAGK
jgi:hypothetical protein